MNYLKKHALLPFLLFLIATLSDSFIFGKITCREEFSLIAYRNPSLSFAEIDSQTLQIVEDIGGGVYYRELDAIIPFFPTILQEEWMNCKRLIAKRIGPIHPGPTKKSDNWKNNALTADQLIEDAHAAAPQFLKMCLAISQQTGTSTNFGIENRHMIKSRRSVQKKIHEYISSGFSYTEAVGKVRDSLRGTIIVEKIEQIPQVVDAIKKYAKNMGREVVFLNLWEENNPSGYVGIHAKMLFPVPSEEMNSNTKNINVEIQIHLKCIMDGTFKCAKERAHLLYAQMHQRGFDSKQPSVGSMLFYFTSMKQYLKKSD